MAKRRRRCKGTTKAGKRCRAIPRHDTGYCNAHSPKEVQEKSGFGGAQPGAGRPRSPHPHEVLREKIEGEVERWLAPLEDALTAERAIVVGSGESAEVERVPDHKVRLRASRDAFDRVYGRPAQAVELTGAGGGAIEVDVLPVDDFDAETRKLAHDLLIRAANAAPRAE